ncbi:MAG: aminotransferase class V-fold PLP-dependent enzyme [Woeseiaceae bacterium]|nr:aminotransferase class V-fold PLP-dependent enzyme [Woeseiaceae bacterium]
MANIDFTRRRLLAGITAGTAMAASGLARAADLVVPVAPPAGRSPADLARDESFWHEVGGFYERTRGILNLEQGYWGRMARPVRDAYIDALRMVDAQNSYYARKDYEADDAEATRRIARALGAHDDEIVITRNATEAFQSLVGQYRGLEAGDTVLLADIDYPGFKQHMHWLAGARGVDVVEIELPPRADQATIRQLYIDAFDANPKTRLMLIMHVSNQHGLTVPVADIAAEARERGIDVICDAAQSWGLLDYEVSDLGVDWAAFNLHKWIGAPLGSGVLYMRRGTLDRIAPFPGESDEQRVASRIHPGTVNFATRLAIPAALDFHEALGPANKEARLRYLRSLWTDAATEMPHLEVLGGADEASWSGIGSFRLRGKTTVGDAQALQARMEYEFGIFTVIRKGLASGACVRVTPQVFNSADEIGRLVDALRRLADA